LSFEFRENPNIFHADKTGHIGCDGDPEEIHMEEDTLLVVI